LPRGKNPGSRATGETARGFTGATHFWKTGLFSGMGFLFLTKWGDEMARNQVSAVLEKKRMRNIIHEFIDFILGHTVLRYSE
jgi:hypothetical protein